MKKTILTLMAAVLGSASVYSQCSPIKNNFEMKLVPTAGHTLAVQVRYHDGAVEKAESVIPTNNVSLYGMVFAITWPTTSAVKITDCKSTLAPFTLTIDNSVGTGVQNKNVNDNIVTFYNAEDMPTKYGFDWANDKWYTIATVSYSGDLKANDYFSFMNCDYGLAHPNSYYGNSHTDPWFMMMDAAGTTLQYSPKMITELPVALNDQINCNIYPNPTSGELNIEIDVNASSNAVIKVLDVRGTVVKIVQTDLEKGKNLNNINIGELPSGEYMIQVTDGKALNAVKKITKK
jgi:Secretion system C-terminal sorting domain